MTFQPLQTTQEDGHPSGVWMQSAFCSTICKTWCYMVQHVVLHRAYPGRVCLSLQYDDVHSEWMTHVLVEKTELQIIVHAQWALTNPDWLDSREDSDIPQESDFVITEAIAEETTRHLHEVFSDLPVVKRPHGVLKVGFYQANNHLTPFHEAFDYALVEGTAEDWEEISAARSLQRAWRRCLARRLRVKRNVFEAWFELCLRPSGTTGRRVVSSLSGF